MDIQEILDNIQLFTETNINKLYEFAYPIKEVRQRFYDLSENIIEHTVKIILYKQEYPDTVNHWVCELHANLSQCMKRQIKRKNNPYATPQEIQQWLLIGYDKPSTMKGLRYSLSSNYSNPIQITDENLYEQVTQFIKFISDPLSKLNLTKQDIIEYFR